ASDGPSQSQTVTVTAIDSDGASSSTSFQLVVRNLPPAVSLATGSTLTVNEGDTATASGTWGDPGTDVVTLSASVGRVTQNANGTWSWTFATGDGPSQSQTVVITATDSDGARSSASFPLVVNNVAPAVTALSASNGTTGGRRFVTVQGAFNDPGLLDTHVVTVDCGDGSA